MARIERVRPAAIFHPRFYDRVHPLLYIFIIALIMFIIGINIPSLILLTYIGTVLIIIYIIYIIVALKIR